MHEVILQHEVDEPGWRVAARGLVAAGVPPEHVVWSVGMPQDLFAEHAAPAPIATVPEFSVPRAFIGLVHTVVQAREPERFALLYRLLWRLRATRSLLEQTTDPDVARATHMAQAVRRDTHKMRAFVRFRAVDDGFVAWFEPTHFIVEANAAFFIRRFATMRWSILTPYRSIHWDGANLLLAPGADRADVPDDDALADYWRVYFTSIFNPARLKISAMTSEMPRKYWKNLPEAGAIPELIRNARERETRMVEQPIISPDRPRQPRVSIEATKTPLAKVAEAASHCQHCPLWADATQTVFGEGDVHAQIMLIGEQPGDQEDLAGRPFVGPAGQLLDRALSEAQLERSKLYVTNAVKHFKFTLRGKRRIHQKPGNTEIIACRQWLEAERNIVQPLMTVLMGATAARAVLGRDVTISRERGRSFALGASRGFITVHPSYLLRLPDPEAREREYAAFVEDFRAVKQSLASGAPFA